MKDCERIANGKALMGHFKDFLALKAPPTKD